MSSRQVEFPNKDYTILSNCESDTLRLAQFHNRIVKFTGEIEMDEVRAGIWAHARQKREAWQYIEMRRVRFDF